MVKSSDYNEGFFHERKKIIEMRGISKSFGGVRALDRVDFEIYFNEVLALVGDNGAGKSTLAKIISGVHTPDEGEIIFEGKKIQINNPREAREAGIEMVYQDLALFNKIDVSGNLFMGKEIFMPGIWGKYFKFLDNKEMHRRSYQFLQGLKIGIVSTKKKAAILSGGQRQAVALGRAVLWEKKFLIMDEPTAALGIKETQQILKLIKNLKEKGLSILIISHNLHDVFSVADRIIVLRNGRRIGEREVKYTTGDEIVKLIVGADVIE